MAKRSSASSDKDFSLAGVCACVDALAFPDSNQASRGICTSSARSLGSKSRHRSIVTAYRPYICSSLVALRLSSTSVCAALPVPQYYLIIAAHTRLAKMARRLMLCYHAELQW